MLYKTLLETSFRRSAIFFLSLVLVLGNSARLYAQITVSFPYTRIVLQQDNNGDCSIFVKGQCPDTLERVEARLVARTTGQGRTTAWQVIEKTPISGIYSGSLVGSGGWYNLEVRGINKGNLSGETTVLERVGIGEVFLIVGHSNAQGGASPSVGSTDDRVSSVTFPTTQMWNDYDQTGDTTFLPFHFSHLKDTIAPFHSTAWLWGQLGDSLAHQLNVPILFYGAAFGGSSMAQTYKSAYDIPFDHGFIKYGIRMPYVNIRNTLIRYAPVTGLRGILLHHGVNDGGSSTSEYKFHTEQVVAKTRQESQHDSLAWMVAKSAWNNRIFPHIVEAQAQIIDQDAQIYVGPNLNEISNLGRTDNLHFNQLGQALGAQKWTVAMVGSPFLNQTKSLLPKQQQAGLPSTSQQSGMWGLGATWRYDASPANEADIFIKSSHTIEIDTPQTAKGVHLSGNIQFAPNGQLNLIGN